MRQGDAIGNAQLRAQVADHAHHFVLLISEVEAALAALAVAGGLALPLGEELREGHAPRGEHPQVAVHRQDVLVVQQGQRGTYADSLLPDAAEPLADLALPEQAQHLLLDHSGPDQVLVQAQ